MRHHFLEISSRSASSVLLLGVVTLFLGPLGCASYTQETEKIRSEFRAHRYSEALASIDDSSVLKEKRNRLLFELEKASILDRMDDTRRARAMFINADKIADELYTESISRTAASFLVNDAMSDYSGEDYEKVLLHTMLALSYLSDNNLNEARVEAAKVNNKLAEINKSYEENKNRYAEDAFARYLSAAIYEAKQEYDNAIIDYREALRLYEGQFKEFNEGNVPENLVAALYRLLGMRGRHSDAAQLAKKYASITARVDTALKALPTAGEILIVQAAGAIDVKVNKEIVLPIAGQIIRFSFPVITPSHREGFGSAGATIQPGNYNAPAEPMQNLSEVASKTLEDRRFRMVAKQGARLVTKGVLTEQAYKNYGPIGGIAANIYSAVSETGDTRSWTLLPRQFLVARIRLKPGEYKVSVHGAFGATQRIVTAKVEPGKIFFIRDFQ